MAGLIKDSGLRKALQADLMARNLELIALNANGNQLHLVDGKRQSDDRHDTIRVAGDLGVKTVVCMSGLPGGGPNETMPNWVVSTWPPETQTILNYQWEDVLLPIGKSLQSMQMHMA